MFMYTKTCLSIPLVTYNFQSMFNNWDWLYTQWNTLGCTNVGRFSPHL